MPSIITHKIAFALRLLDTTNGADANGASQFRVNGTEERPILKPEGLYLFLGEYGEAANLEVSVFGYESLRRQISMDSLNPEEPVVTLELVPNDFYQAYRPYHTLTGVLPGIQSLGAAKLGETSCLIREFDARKKVLSIFNPHHLTLDRAVYTLVDPDGLTYEPFVIVKHLTDQTFKIDRPLKEGFLNHFSVTPEVFGRVDADGRYLLRVRDTGAACRWLVRFAVGQEIFFQYVDFQRPETTALAAQSSGVSGAWPGR